MADGYATSAICRSIWQYEPLCHLGINKLYPTPLLASRQILPQIKRRK